MTHGFALESWAGQVAVDGYCKFWDYILSMNLKLPVHRAAIPGVYCIIHKSTKKMIHNYKILDMIRFLL
jgi:hypothetical protein